VSEEGAKQKAFITSVSLAKDFIPETLRHESEVKDI
jgi:hypothetical protein